MVQQHADASAAALCYLRQIYTGLNDTTSLIDTGAATEHVQALRVLYRERAAMCNVSMRGTKRWCSNAQRELIRVDERSYPGLLGNCNSSLFCEIRAFHYMPSWAAQLKEGFDVNNWVEVNRFALGGKAAWRKPESWREFLDGGLSGWWYYRAPGSGIFYRTGATRIARNKPAMMCLLLHEWAASTVLKQSKLLLHTLQRLTWYESRNGTVGSLERLQAEAVTYFQQMHDNPNRPLHMSDAWDALLIRMGRLLGYDTLVFTTEYDYSSRQASASLVDLRTPFGLDTEPFNLRMDLVHRRKLDSPALMIPEGSILLDEARARNWVDYVASSGVLCLGSPPTLEAHRRGTAVASPCVRRCDFTQALTVRLACPGHISWELRNAPHPGCYKY